MSRSAHPHPYAAYAASLHPPSSAGSPNKAPLVVVGSINADLVVRLKRLPKKGETISTADN